MGFFDAKVSCSVCGETVGLNRNQLRKNEWICPSCLKKAGGVLNFGNLQKMSISEIQDLIAEKENRIAIGQEFVPTKKIGNYFFVNEDEKQWVIPKGEISGKIKDAIIHSYSDIVDFELLEDGNSISSGGVGRALIGGALFGTTGALLGGITGGKKSKNTCTKLQIKITVKNDIAPAVYVNLLSGEFKKDGFIYKSAAENAQTILSLLQLMCDENSNTSPVSGQASSSADELMKFKQLLDMGAITQDEFDKKKKELLGF